VDFQGLSRLKGIRLVGIGYFKKKGGDSGGGGRGCECFFYLGIDILSSIYYIIRVRLVPQIAVFRRLKATKKHHVGEGEFYE